MTVDLCLCLAALAALVVVALLPVIVYAWCGDDPDILCVGEFPMGLDVQVLIDDAKALVADVRAGNYLMAVADGFKIIQELSPYLRSLKVATHGLVASAATFTSLSDGADELEAEVALEKIDWSKVMVIVLKIISLLPGLFA